MVYRDGRGKLSTHAFRVWHGRSALFCWSVQKLVPKAQRYIQYGFTMCTQCTLSSSVLFLSSSMGQVSSFICQVQLSCVKFIFYLDLNQTKFLGQKQKLRLTDPDSTYRSDSTGPTNLWVTQKQRSGSRLPEVS